MDDEELARRVLARQEPEIRAIEHARRAHLEDDVIEDNPAYATGTSTVNIPALRSKRRADPMHDPVRVGVYEFP